MNSGACGLAASLALWLCACGTGTPAVPFNHLQQVQRTGVLRVAATYGRTTCYSGPQGLLGYECDLAQGAAHSIGATAEVLFTRSTADALLAVREGRADIAAASITPSLVLRAEMRTTRAIDRVSQQLVFRMGNTRPRGPEDLDGRLLVAEGDGHSAELRRMKSHAPKLIAETTRAYDAEDLLYQVAKGELDYTIASSTLVAINARYYPYLRTAFSMGDEQDVVFALKRDEDASLYDAVERYLASLEGAAMARLHDRYYGHVEELNYFSAVQVANHMRSRLPRYLPIFKNVADQHGLDWRLLAAIGYQESHWDPQATSYTGVRGIMMLTNDTALRYKVANRDDPAQSIEGGAKVLEDIFAAIPPDIQEPDRSWMALAAYNQGIGHLLDAWALTRQRGGDPTHWVDVRDTYPLLSRPRWASSAKYGLARGREAVDFVANVRAYYDLITMLASGVRVLPPPPLKLDSQLRTASTLRSDAADPPSETDPVLQPQLTPAPSLQQEPLPPASQGNAKAQTSGNESPERSSAHSSQ